MGGMTRTTEKQREYMRAYRAAKPKVVYELTCAYEPCGSEFRTERRRKFCNPDCQVKSTRAEVSAKRRQAAADNRARRRLPVEPLFEFIDRNGGWDGMVFFYPHLERVTTSKTETKGFGGEDGLLVELDPAYRSQYRTDRARLNEFRARGWVDYYKVDEMAVRIFGVHPSQIYGDLWWERSA